ncbi:hypothetical protein C8F04DRAFT_1192632 [Mycena alexandri]|uniref:Uncharacterized protein n=1 Tax=Mycena alexandri TaxID=1745969 RepID=A0AAD6SAE4_9AGAR|nr:hypothetical protein C8F04DRAFT_1192632 [Mycena alexandri]
MTRSTAHTHTGVAYPSHPLQARLFTLCLYLPIKASKVRKHTLPALLRHIHIKSTGPVAHDADGRRTWRLLKHPQKPGVFSDQGSLKGYLKKLTPGAKTQAHALDDSAKVGQYSNALKLAHALYKWCTTHHTHETTPEQRKRSQHIVPPTKLEELLFYHPTGQHGRLKLSRTHPRTGSLFPAPTFFKGLLVDPQDAPDTLKRVRSESPDVPLASQGKKRRSNRDDSGPHVHAPNRIVYREAVVTQSTCSAGLPSAPTPTAPSKNIEIVAPALPPKSRAPAPKSLPCTPAATTKPLASVLPHAAPAPTAKSDAETAAGARPCPYYYFTDGRVRRTIEEADKAFEENPVAMTIVRSLAEVEQLFWAGRVRL